jgi:sugar transferase (PEP-CTERM/EpsH1 system associated)
VKVLFLTHRLPYAPNRGDRIRAFHIVKSLAARDELELVSLVHDQDELAQVPRLEAMGIHVTAIPVTRMRNLAMGAAQLAGARPLTHSLLDAPDLVRAIRDIVQHRPPDVVLAFCSGMARFALEPPLSGFPLVVDMVDVDSQKWLALSESAGWPMRWIYEREARHLAAFERRIAASAATTFVVNEREREVMRTVAPGPDVAILPNGVELPQAAVGAPEERPRVVFCGVMNYQPNVDAVLWFARDIWPAIRVQRPDAHFSIVGSSPSNSVRRLQSADNGIEVTGTVADVRPHLERSAVAVAPLLTARGVQNKVLEALAMGVPAVVSQAVFDGLPRCVRGACGVAESADDYSTEIVRLLAMAGAERRRLAQAADLTQLSWKVQLRPLHDALAAAARRTRAVAV